jgi:hypothetical protein
MLDERDPDVVILDLPALDDLDDLRAAVVRATGTPFVALALRADDPPPAKCANGCRRPRWSRRAQLLGTGCAYDRSAATSLRS